MGRISKYIEIAAPDVDDLLIGTDVENGNETKNFTIQSIADLVSGAAGITPTLQQVTAAGNTTTYDITANKFKKPGGQSSQILAANGDVITAGNNITIALGVISATGSGGGTGSTDITYVPSPTSGTIVSSTGEDGTIPLAGSINAGLFSPAEKTTLSGLVTLKENALGNPSVTGYVLSSTTAGQRTWIANGTGSGGSGITSITATSPITSSGGTTPVISTSMSTNKLIGRSTTGTGVMEQISIGTGLTLSAGVLSSSSSLGVFNGTTLTDGPQLGSEILTSLSTVPTGWTGTSFSTGYTHTSGSGTTIIQDTNSVVDLSMYVVSYTISNRTTGSVSISVGGLSKLNVAQNTTNASFSGIVTDSSPLTITPSSTFNGKIIVSLKALTPSVSISKFLRSNGSIGNEFRYSTSGSLFIGAGSGEYNLTGTNNTFIGDSSGYLNVKGFENTFLGTETGRNSTKDANTFIGSLSGYSNTEGFENSFLGARSGYSNTTGSSNVFLGYSSGYFNTTGIYNSFLGDSAGYLNISSSGNTFLGSSAGYSHTSAGDNTFIGSFCGYSSVSGYGNIFVGASTNGLTDSDINSIIIGTAVTGLGTNTTVIGTVDTTSTTLGGAVSIQTGTLQIPNASAQLDVISTTKGFLPPRMTTAQINAIVSPANGLVVFNTTLNTICFFTTTWQKVASIAM